MLRVQEGDANAFEVLYRRYVDRIYPLTLRMSGDVVRAEELTQDIFVRAWEKIRLFHARSSFYTWLYRLAMNHVLQKERSRRREERRVLAPDPSRLRLSAASRAPESNLPISDCSADSRIDLQRALSRLPKKARAVLILHEMEGKSHPEIARLMGIAPGTSKAQLHRARSLLKEALCR